jgi:hypothetical protein
MQNGDVLSRVLGALLIALGVLAYLDMLAIVALWRMHLGITPGDIALADLFGCTPETWRIIDTAMFVACSAMLTVVCPLFGIITWRGIRTNVR